MRPDGGGTGGGGGPAAAYVFRVRVRLPTEGVDARPDEFETTVRWPAAEPGESGWLFFRDHCWRGEASDDVAEVRHRHLGSSVHVTDDV